MPQSPLPRKTTGRQLCSTVLCLRIALHCMAVLLSDCCKSVLPPVQNAATESAYANWQAPLSIEVHHLGGVDFDGDEGQKGRKLPVAEWQWVD